MWEGLPSDYSEQGCDINKQACYTETLKSLCVLPKHKAVQPCFCVAMENCPLFLVPSKVRPRPPPSPPPHHSSWVAFSNQQKHTHTHRRGKSISARGRDEAAQMYSMWGSIHGGRVNLLCCTRVDSTRQEGTTGKGGGGGQGGEGGGEQARRERRGGGRGGG